MSAASVMQAASAGEVWGVAQTSGGLPVPRSVPQGGGEFAGKNTGKDCKLGDKEGGGKGVRV